MDAALGLLVRPLRSTGEVSRRLAAFALIVAATTVVKFGRARSVVHPLIWRQIRQAGLGLLPFAMMLSVIGGFIVVGQTIIWLRQFGAQDMLGTVMVVVVFRELAPLTTALLVLLRIGTPTVVELATMRATGEVEALEALSIDPVHFLVVPRVIGLSVSVFCLTIYFVIGTLLSGYAFCFLQQLPLDFREYLRQIGRALTWQDFLLLTLKSGMFGALTGVIACYQGLARPLRLDQVPTATTRAVTQSLMTFVLLDGAFLALYFLI